MVVCEANKRVICDPLKANNQAKCLQDSTTKAVARCPFDVQVWDLGATCIASHVNKLLKSGPCRSSAAKALLLKSKCEMAKPTDHLKCSRLAISF